MKIKVTFFLVIFLLNLSVAYLSFAQQIDPQLKALPVVIKGNKLGLLNAYKPQDLVGFKYSNNGWEQIIIQVDEMKRVSGAQIYNNYGLQHAANPADSWDGRGGPEYDYDGKTGGINSFLVYADPNTFTGTDQDIFFDSNDELVYMARDAGRIPLQGDLFPDGVDSCSGVQLRISDPNTGLTGYVYIFKRDLNYISPLTGTYLQQDAGLTHPVSYNFQFKRNNSFKGPTGYKQYYHRQYGPNPETSIVTTANYIKGFGDRWVENKLIITASSSPGMLPSAGLDMLDGHKTKVVPLSPFENMSCGRTENTFAGIANEDGTLRPQDATATNSTKGYGGAFIANINGPLRAIRSYMGANSGVLTQRDNICYDQIELINTYLRLHPISGMLDFYDYEPLAGNMIYNNNNNMPATQHILNGRTFTGILIDGNNDIIKPGPIIWELINSASGSIFRYNRIHNPDKVSSLFLSTYYHDSKTPNIVADPQCTGDSIPWGASGLLIKNRSASGRFINLPDTEVRYPGSKTLSLSQYNVYLQPETYLTERTAWINIFEKEVTVTVTAWQNTAECESRKHVSADVYPNPSSGRFVLKVGGSPYQKVKIAVYDILGRSVYSTERIGTVNENIDIQGRVNSGVYVVAITINGTNISKKILINK